jgi:hypothetical protein
LIFNSSIFFIFANFRFIIFLFSDLDEKFYEPFLSNSVAVVVAPQAARLAAPHRPDEQESYIDAARFDSPAELAEYLLWLQANPLEYLKYFDYRISEANQRRGPPAALRDIENAGVYLPGTLCRLCSCLCSSSCMKKRQVGKCGYSNH